MKKSKRLFELYKYLVEQKEPVSIQVLSQLLDVSRRTIRYDLDEIEDLIANYELNLVRKPNYGISLEGKKEVQSQVFAEFDHFYSSRHFRSARMRKYLILYKLFQKREPILIFELADLLDVSSATVSKDLDQVEKWLENKNLTLIRKRNYGVEIKGEEIDIRHAMKTLINESYETDSMIELLNESNKNINFKNKAGQGYSRELQNLLGELDLTEIEEIVKKAEDKLEIKFSDSAFSGLTVHIAFAVSRLLSEQDIKIDPKRLKILKKKEEYKTAAEITKLLENKFEVKIPEDEIAFITIHLLGAQMRKGKATAEIEENDLDYIVDEMIRVVEKYFSVDLTDDHKLRSGLLIHLQAIVNRIIFDLPIKNPLLEDIKEKYGESFKAAKLAARIIQSEYYVEISEDEIGYLSIHFGAALERINYQQKQKARVAVVCSSGVGTTNLLEVRLKNEFKAVEIVKTLSSLEIEDNDILDDIDFIISTIPLNLERIDVLEVNPFLTEEDIEKIKTHLQKNEIEYGIFSENETEAKLPAFNTDKFSLNKQELSAEEIIKILKPYLKDEKTAEALNELKMEINDSDPQKSEKTKYKLLDLLSADQINIIDKSLSWQGGIEAAAKILETKNYIESRYTKKMIDIIKDKGPYIAIAPHICLAHAGVEDGVNKAAISFGIIKEGFKLGHQFDPIRFVFVLAPEDKNSHMPALTDIIDFANNESLMERVLKADNKEKIYKLLENNFSR